MHVFTGHLLAYDLAERLSPRRVLLFPLQNRGPKEDGVRNAKVNSSLKMENQVMIHRVRGSCRLPRSMATPRTVKSFDKNSSGCPHGFAGSSPGLKGVASELL